MATTITPCFEVKSTVAELLKETTKVEILLSMPVCGGMDNDYELTGESRQSWEKTTVAEFTAKWLGGADDLMDHKISFRSVVGEFFDDVERGFYVAILTPKDGRDYRSSSWAKSLNFEAQMFCTKHKVTIATPAFFNALRGELRAAKSRMNSYFGGEASAERYATYQACGSGAYWSDNDFMASRLSQPIERLREIRRFCRLKLPLQYAMWKESLLKDNK
jgi:hypothetical protein